MFAKIEAIFSDIFGFIASNQVQEEKSIKDISYKALAASLFSGLEQFVQYWKKAS